jgi:trehalose 6-phosphate phosphatase
VTPPEEISQLLRLSLTSDTWKTEVSKGLQNCREVSGLRHLFQRRNELIKCVREATQILLFLDYDGTLTAIVARPEMAVLPLQAKEVLARISRNDVFKLAIISGRSLEDVKILIGLENVAYAGNHGLEIECPPRWSQGQEPGTTSFIHPVAERFKPRLIRLEQRLRERLASIDGILIENKGLSLSLHYRLVRQTAVGKTEKLVSQAIEDEEETGGLRVTTGKKVFEVRPDVEWNKGRAIEWLLQTYGPSGNLPIFVGDDMTDEDGFRVIHSAGGISVIVAEAAASTAADYYLDSPDQLYQWLGELVKERQ